MRRELLTLALCVVLPASVVAQAPAKGAPDGKAAVIARALSAAPPALAAHAAVADMDEKGRMTTLRAGDNGWTCMPKDPGTPLPCPVCVDRNGLAWLEAAMKGEPPDPALVGYSYMLQGGTAWSLADPTAMSLPKGETTYATIGPHIMILNAKLARESGFPGGAHPDTRRPFVAYAGTPFAIIIMPVR